MLAHTPAGHLTPFNMVEIFTFRSLGQPLMGKKYVKVRKNSGKHFLPAMLRTVQAHGSDYCSTQLVNLSQLEKC